MKLKELLEILDECNDITLKGCFEKEYTDLDGELATKFVYGVIFEGEVKDLKKQIIDKASSVSGYEEDKVVYVDACCGEIKLEQYEGYIDEDSYYSGEF